MEGEPTKAIGDLIAGMPIAVEPDLQQFGANTEFLFLFVSELCVCYRPSSNSATGQLIDPTGTHNPRRFRTPFMDVLALLRVR